MRAVLLATTTGAAAHAGEEAVPERLVRQIRGFGVTDIHIIARSEYRTGLPSGVNMLSSSGVREDLRLLNELASGDGPLLIACADAVLPDTAVSAVLSDPTTRSGVLVGPTENARPLDVPLHRSRGMVLSVGTRFHTVSDANVVGSGLAKVSAPHMPRLRSALERLRADSVADLAPGADAWTLTLLGLVRDGAKLNGYEVPGLPYGRVAGAAGAQQLLADIDACDEDATRLDLCVKRDDDMFATYCVSSYSRKLVSLSTRLRLTPAAVTWISILLAGGSAALFISGYRWAMIAGALAMYLSFVLDCVDGQLARYTHRFSAFGGWLDMIADRGKEYMIYGGLAAGAAAQGITWAWPLAIIAIVVQVTRHMGDTWYGTLRDDAELNRSARVLTEPDDGLAPVGAGSDLGARAGQKLGQLSAQFSANRRSASYWFKRTIVFPVGERWLVMGVLAAIFDGGVALAALLGWQLLALAYTLAGRSLQAWALRTAMMTGTDNATHRDDGFLARVRLPVALPLIVVAAAPAAVAVAAGVIALAPTVKVPMTLLAAVVVLAVGGLTMHERTGGRLDWLVPGALRGAECGLVAVCGWAAGVPSGWVFGLLLALALYHYDLAARVDKAASPLVSRTAGLGWDGRVVLVLAALIPPISTWVYVALTAYITLVFLGGSLLGRRGGSSGGETPHTAPTPDGARA